MLNTIKNILIITVGFVLAFLLYSGIKKRNSDNSTKLNSKKNNQHISDQVLNRADQVKKVILKYKKPARIEFESFTQRFQKDVEEIRRLKIPMDETSPFFMQVQLFSDDSDETAPLILQIKFKDVKSLALIQEESINLD